MRPDRRWLYGAAALLWFVLAGRWAGWGWAVLYLAAAVAVAAASWVGARLPAAWPARRRPWLVVAGAHACLLAGLGLAHAWAPLPLAALYGPVVGGGAAPPGGTTQQLQATARRLLRGKQWGQAVQPLQELAARTPLASTYVLLGEAKAQAGQVGSSPYTLGTARFLGARGEQLEEALGTWDMRAGGGHPAYLLLAQQAFLAAAASAAGSQKAQYEQLAAKAAAQATRVFGAAPEPLAGNSAGAGG